MTKEHGLLNAVFIFASLHHATIVAVWAYLSVDLHHQVGQQVPAHVQAQRYKRRNKGLNYRGVRQNKIQKREAVQLLRPKFLIFAYDAQMTQRNIPVIVTLQSLGLKGLIDGVRHHVLQESVRLNAPSDAVSCVGSPRSARLSSESTRWTLMDSKV